MANIKSAEKRILVNQRKQTENRMIKSALATQIKKYNASIKAGDLALATKLLPITVAEIDAACSKGVIHKNSANNKKATAAKKLDVLAKTPAKAPVVEAKKVEVAPVVAAPVADKKAKKAKKA